MEREGKEGEEWKERGMEKKRRMFVLGYDFMSPSISIIIAEINPQGWGITRNIRVCIQNAL